MIPWKVQTLSPSVRLFGRFSPNEIFAIISKTIVSPLTEPAILKLVVNLMPSSQPSIGFDKRHHLNPNRAVFSAMLIADE